MYMEPVSTFETRDREHTAPAPAHTVVGLAFLAVVVPMTLVTWLVLGLWIAAALIATHVVKGAKLVLAAAAHAGELLDPGPRGRRSAARVR